jgi:ATP-dependent RNA helicase DeaD
LPSYQDLHLKPAIADALEELGWTPDDPAVKLAAPTAARGHNLVSVTPPVPVYAVPALAGLLSRLGEGDRALVLAPPNQLQEWGAAVHRLIPESANSRVLVAHGPSRAMRHLRVGLVDLLIASPETALALVAHSALSLETIAAMFLAWPEGWPEEESLTPLMQDLPKDRQRVIYTADPQRVAGLVDRYAWRAMTIGANEGGPPVGPVRTVTVAWARRVPALAELIEVLDPAALAVFTADRGYHASIAETVGRHQVQLVTSETPSAEMIIAFDLPTRERLSQLLSTGQVVLLTPPGTESYVARIASPRRPLQLPGLLDAAANAAAMQRATISRTIEAGQWQRALLTLAPLFERHDPAAVAGALFELWTHSAPASPQASEHPVSAKVYVSVGKKDSVTANDLVAALTKELRVERGKIGRIELRETYSLIELPAQDAETVARGLNAITVRRKRVKARVDRGGKPGGRGSRGL